MSVDAIAIVTVELGSNPSMSADKLGDKRCILLDLSRAYSTAAQVLVQFYPYWINVLCLEKGSAMSRERLISVQFIKQTRFEATIPLCHTKQRWFALIHGYAPFSPNVVDT